MRCSRSCRICDAFGAPRDSLGTQGARSVAACNSRPARPVPSRSAAAYGPRGRSQLARPEGPLAAVDLADGRALVAELSSGEWVEVPAGPVAAPRAPAWPAPARRRRLGTALAAAAVAGAAGSVALAAGFSGTPAPAAARPVKAVVRSQPAPLPRAVARGGRAPALPPVARTPPPSPPVAVAEPPPPPPRAPLPELPSAPAL
jgi:hypothetical protein